MPGAVVASGPARLQWERSSREDVIKGVICKQATSWRELGLAGAALDSKQAPEGDGRTQSDNIENMVTNHRLFDVSPQRPTTRTVALLLRTAGSAALVDAVHRADAARYHEVICRSALNRVEGILFTWTLNPYRGCTHGCHYCFARRYQSHLELDPDDEFSSVILVKINFPEILRRELARPSWKKALVAFGTATDPYQPIEGQYKLTRRSLEVLVAHPTPSGLVPKGPMAVRDADLLAELSRRTRCTVYFSVPTVDAEAWHVLEPGTAHPLQRLRAVRELNDAAVNTGVLMAPIVQGFTSHPAKLERTIKTRVDHGARFIGTTLLHLEGGTLTHFMEFLSRKFPHLVTKYDRLYAGRYARRSYAAQVHGILDTSKQRYAAGLRRGGTDTESDYVEGPVEGERVTQASFPWYG